jgi:hypothetical protein
MKSIFLLAGLALATSAFASEKDYQLPARMTPALVSAALDPALMCLATYTDARVAGWDGPSLNIGSLSLDDPISGFHACLYQRESSGKVAFWLAFRGTDFTSAEDWLTNFRQNILRKVPEQYRIAYLRTQQLKGLVLVCRRDGRNAEVWLTGHSLGAGLGAFSALCWALPAFCFASAPLAAGTEKQIEQTGLAGLRRAPEFVTHFFMEGDRVPDIAILFGGHFGRIITPELTPPENMSGIDSERKRMGVLMLAGLAFDKNKYLRTASGANTVLDIFARHDMSNYVSALMANAAPTDGTLSVTGCWRSLGSFFQISSSETSFLLCANGALELQNAFVFLGGKSFTADKGSWSFDGQTLRVVIPNIATMEYVLMGAVEQRGISWRRTRVIADEQGFLQKNSKEGGSATGSLLLLKGACHLMQNKDVAWTRNDRDLFSEVFR